jgi:hypothetical protein
MGCLAYFSPGDHFRQSGSTYAGGCHVNRPVEKGEPRRGATISRRATCPPRGETLGWSENVEAETPLHQVDGLLNDREGVESRIFCGSPERDDLLG